MGQWMQFCDSEGPFKHSTFLLFADQHLYWLLEVPGRKKVNNITDKFMLADCG